MRPPRHEQVKVRFDQTAGLSAFCQALRLQGISYALAGNGTVVLDTPDYERLVGLKIGVLKDYPPHVDPVVPFHALDPQVKAEVVRHRLLPTWKLLENIRARLAKSS
jgi:hypothetical protein